MKKKFETNSEFSGGLKNFGICSLQNNKIFITGGVLISTNMPSNLVYEINGGNCTVATKKKNMNLKRYGHG